jgi:hypothetical protein
VKGTLFSRRRWILGLFVLGALIAACSALGHAIPTTIPQATPNPYSLETLVVTTATATAVRPPELVPIWTSTPNQAADNARNAIIATVGKLQHAGPFHIHSVTTTEDGKSEFLDGDVILPDRFHITSAGAEILIVADQAYSKQGGSWVKLETDAGSLVSELIGDLSGQLIQGITHALLVHPEAIDGTPAHEYQYQSSVIVAGEKFVSANQIWISDASGLPVHQETSAVLSGVQTTTVQEIRYDPSIKIDAPSAP